MAKPSTQLNTPPGILAFSHLFIPRARAKDKEPDYNANLIFDASQQKHPAYARLREACLLAIEQRFGDLREYRQNPEAFVARLEKSDSWPIKDGSDKEYAGFGPGTTYISPWSKDKPDVLRWVGPGPSDFVDVSADEVWAGQIVKFNVKAFAWENSGKRGVSFGLGSVLLIKEDMPRLDGRVSGRKAFEGDDDLGQADPFG